MTGGHTDNYYYQLIENVRKYKGVSKLPEPGEKTSIDIKGDFSQWENITSVYYDHLGDTEHRNHPGYQQAGPYINTTGRNDIIESRVARDDDYIYVYVKTNEDLTTHTDPNWMLLFIDVDQDHSTGWEGYDLLINSNITSENSTTLMVRKKDKWKPAGEIQYRYSGNELMMAIPKSLAGETTVAMDFHWADNIQKLDDINEFFLNGDSAPERRSNYRFKE
jgi:hypothetical protein